MLRPSLILLPLAVLAACASPLERCISDANRQLNTLDQQIAVTQGNINRGFGIFETQDVRVLRRTCTDRREDGTKFRYRCDRTETFTRREPVALNIQEERIKLRQLQDRREATARQSQTGVQQCIAAFPAQG